MNAYPVSFSIRAVRDLDAIYDYIAADSPTAAEKIISRLETFCFETLSAHPYAGIEVGSLQKGLRSFNVSAYRVLYSVPKQSVMIKRIIHGSRDTKSFDLE